MSQLITKRELEDLEEHELQSTYDKLLQDLAQAERWRYEYSMVFASMEIVQRQMMLARDAKARASRG